MSIYLKRTYLSISSVHEFILGVSHCASFAGNWNLIIQFKRSYFSLTEVYADSSKWFFLSIHGKIIHRSISRSLSYNPSFPILIAIPQTNHTPNYPRPRNAYHQAFTLLSNQERVLGSICHHKELSRPLPIVIATHLTHWKKTWCSLLHRKVKVGQ